MTPPEQERLLPCPFCGVQLIQHTLYKSNWQHPLSIDSHCPLMGIVSTDSKQWNTRHTPSIEGGVKVFKTEKWQQGRQWPPEVVLDCGSNMPFDVHAVRDDGWGVRFIRHDLAGQKSSGEMVALLTRWLAAQGEKDYEAQEAALFSIARSTRNFLSQLESKGEV